MDNYEFAEKIAREYICPYALNNEPATIWEHNTIKYLRNFGAMVLNAKDALSPAATDSAPAETREIAKPSHLQN